MPKRKKQQEEAPPSESEEEAPAGSEGKASSGSDSDSDSFPSGAEGSSGGESSDDEGGEAFEQVDVDFGFYSPQEKDFLGLKTLLQGYLDGQQWACSELVDAIIQQGSGAAVGSVVKCGEEDDPIGVSTVLSLQRHGGSRPLQQLRDFLLAAASVSGYGQRLEQVWAAPGTALVVNERLVNCPPELAEPLQESLFGEVEEAAGDEELSQEEREQFKLRQFLMVVRAYSDPAQQQQQQQADGAGGSGSGGKQKKKAKKGKGGAAASPVVHFLPEAECYQAAADWSFTFPVADRLVGKDELQPCRCVMLVSAAGVKAARKQLAALMHAAAAGGGQ